MGTAPPGWPRDLEPPDAPDFQAAVIPWLLDRCPPEFRGHEVLRRHPRVLARFAAYHCQAVLEGARLAYASARRDLAGAVEPSTLDEALRALESEGARLAVTVREVGLVDEALAGTRWVPRL